MCLGGHLAYRCALDPRVVATVCYFATDIHSRSLGEGVRDDSLERAKDIKGELVMVCDYLHRGAPSLAGQSNTDWRIGSLDFWEE